MHAGRDTLCVLLSLGYPSDVRNETSDPAALIARAVLRLGRRLRAARPEGAVSLSAFALLTALNRLGPMAAARLAQEERLQPQSLTRLLAALEADGLITRRRDQEDRRALIIEITAGGRRAIARDMAARRAWLDQAMEMALDADERLLLTQAAELMLRVAGQDPPMDADEPPPRSQP